ncbi:MAG: DinB family protein, partial [Phycisphaerales bacterium]|nr:DinB family protein [Phycisphaerales bacterium]
FHQRFEMGVGSLHDTLLHVLGAMRGWGDLLAGREQRERLEAGGRRTCAELAALLADLSDELERLAAAHPLEEVVTGARGGRSFSFTRGGVLTHVTTHGMHHRAQCLNMLRQLGVEPLPPVAVVEWILMVDAPAG